MDVTADEAEDVGLELWELGAQGVEERDASTLESPTASEVTLIASFADESGAREAMKELSHRVCRLEFVVGDDWRDKYKEFFKVTRLGRRLVIRPSWEPFEPGADDVVVTVDPGRAFGTGTHESTQLLLRALDSLVEGDEEVLDVGCGTGILAIAALKLGARQAVCVDIDPAAAEVTLENAELNEVAASVQASTTDVADLSGQFPVVLANIQANVLSSMADVLVQRTAPGGYLLLSGILTEQGGEVRKSFAGMQSVSSPQEGEWVALILQKPN